MNTSKKNSSLFILLSFIFFSATSNLLAVPTHRLTVKEQKQQKKRTLKQTWSKVGRLKWSDLDKKDAWNIFLTTVTVGSVAGGSYLAYRTLSNRARLHSEYMRCVQIQQERQNDDLQDNFPQQQPQVDSEFQSQAHYHDPRPLAILERRVVLARDVECPICFDDMEVIQEINQLPCGTDEEPHRFCTNCLRNQIYVALKELNLPTCLQMGCSAHLSERNIRLVTDNDPQIIQRFDQATRNSITSSLSQDEQAIFCPGANCIMHWVIDRGSKVTITCAECQTRFCSECHNNHDENLTCQQARQHEEHATDNWIRQNTRRCPGCRTSIQRSDGCNYMTCKCGTDFCWNCGGRAVDGESILSCDSYTCRTTGEHVWG